MKLKALNPRQSLNKAFLKLKPVRSEIEKFKEQLSQLISESNDTESEEFHKNLVSDFLKKTYYEPQYFINTKGRNDLVIHTGKTAKTPVGVIIPLLFGICNPEPKGFGFVILPTSSKQN